jgi:hypothetical protein
MKSFVATVALAAAGLFAVGCATKKYARNTVAPIHTRADQVADHANKNSQSIEDTCTEVKDVDERGQIGTDAAHERAADANRRNIAKLRGAIENIDDYKLQASANVSFGFDKCALSKDAGQELDKSAGEAKL